MPKKTKTKTTKKKVSSAKKATKKKAVIVETTKVSHVFTPEHIKLSEKQKEDLFTKYNIKIKELPKILITDPAIRHLEPKENDIIKIIRKSPTAGETIFYRGVINEWSNSSYDAK